MANPNVTGTGAGVEITGTLELVLGQKDLTWDKYGMFEAQILYNSGELTPSAYKAVVRNGELASIVGSNYCLLPNEEVLALIADAGWEASNVSYCRGENVMYAEVLSDKVLDAEVGDPVQVGIVVRNSIDGTLSFGVDAFTYRLACKNGAVSGKETISNLIRKHIGDRLKLLLGFKEAIFNGMEAAAKLIDGYKLMAEVPFTPYIATQLVDVEGIPMKYMPSYAERAENGKFNITAAATLWQGFNAITTKVWHSEDLNMTGRVDHTKRLHRVALAAIAR